MANQLDDLSKEFESYADAAILSCDGRVAERQSPSTTTPTRSGLGES
jgi:hypothetical protein